MDLGGELADGEAVRCRGEGEHGRQRVTDPLVVQVDTADAGDTQRGSGGQLIEDVVAEESGVHAVQGGGESFGDAGQLGHDLGKLLDHPPAAQLGGVVYDRLEPKHAFAFGVGLTGQPPEVQLEHGQVIRRCLDRGLDHRGLLAGAAGTRAAPKMVRILGTSSRERVRSTTASKIRCICCPSAKIRLRLYSS